MKFPRVFVIDKFDCIVKIITWMNLKMFFWDLSDNLDGEEEPQ